MSLTRTRTAEWGADLLIDLALEEDLGSALVEGDITLAALAEAGGRPELIRRSVAARAIAKSPGVLSGIQLFAAVFERLAARAERSGHLECEVLLSDGASLSPGAVCARLCGDGDLILAAERTALNFLQRLSGVATATRAFVESVRGTRARILDTRKTTPGWRLWEKAAVVHGGGVNHRFGLHDQVLLKENHFGLALGAELSGPDAAAFGRCVAAVRERVGAKMVVVVEVRDELQAVAAASAGADVVMLDNFEPAQAAAAVERLRADRSLFPRAVEVEISGGVNIENVRAWAETGVDRISIGALTHSAPALDLSLLLDEAQFEVGEARAMKGLPRRGLKLRFSARKEAVPRVRNRVREFLIQERCPSRSVDEFVLALDELCNNAVEHGCCGSSEAFELVIRLDHARCETSAALQGPGDIPAEELAAMTQSSSLPDLESERGRGLYLFRALVDAFEVRRLADGLLEMRFKKRW